MHNSMVIALEKKGYKRLAKKVDKNGLQWLVDSTGISHWRLFDMLYGQQKGVWDDLESGIHKMLKMMDEGEAVS